MTDLHVGYCLSFYYCYLSASTRINYLSFYIPIDSFLIDSFLTAQEIPLRFPRYDRTGQDWPIRAYELYS